MTNYTIRMTMLSVRIDDEMADGIDSWCSKHETPRSDFLREAVRRELNRRRSIDEAEWVGSLEDDDDAAAAFEAIEAWGLQEDWSQWHAWLDARDAVQPAAHDPSGAGDDSAG